MKAQPFSLTPLFQSNIAKDYWKKIIQPGDLCIDATCGNGRDTLELARLALTEDTGHLIAIDIQQPAIEKTKQLLERELSSRQMQRVSLVFDSHDRFPELIQPLSVKLIVYNLGYLPKSDKKIRTEVSTTLESLKMATSLIAPGGGMSIMCYPGHAEGAEEERHLIEWSKGLDVHTWGVCYLQWINRHLPPSLLLISKLS